MPKAMLVFNTSLSIYLQTRLKLPTTCKKESVCKCSDFISELKSKYYFEM